MPTLAEKSVLAVGKNKKTRFSHAQGRNHASKVGGFESGEARIEGAKLAPES